MRVNTNVNALVAYRNLSTANASSSDSMAKLSTGFRINRAADDAAGLGIANQLRANTRSMVQASRNAEQANSVLQIAEGSTTTIQKMLERMKELATQAASDTVDADGRTRLQTEFSALANEIDRTVDTTKFGSTKLIDGTNGSGSVSFSFMVSSSGDYAAQDNVSLSLSSLKTSELGMRQAGASASAGITFSGTANADASALIRYNGHTPAVAESYTVVGSTGTGPTVSGSHSADIAATVRYATTASASRGTYSTGTISAGSDANATATGTMLVRQEAGVLEGWNAAANGGQGAWQNLNAVGGVFSYNGVDFTVTGAVNGDTFTVQTSAKWEYSTDAGNTWSDVGPTDVATLAGGVTIDVSAATKTEGSWQVNYSAAQAEVHDWEVSTDGGTTWGNVLDQGNQTHTLGGVTFDLSGASKVANSTLSTVLNNGQALSLGSISNAQSALAAIDTAIGRVNETLGNIGAAQNRIDYATQNVKTAIVNNSAAESVIRDLDMAEELSKFSKNNIIAQAATSMLAQANQSTQGVLQLLRG